MLKAYKYTLKVRQGRKSGKYASKRWEFMTKAEMSQLQEVARKYSQYGYTLLEICEFMNDQPKELPFNQKLNMVRFVLSNICNCPEYFNIQEAAEMFDISPEDLLNYVKENKIDYIIKVSIENEVK